jgi:hypothetical protein
MNNRTLAETIRDDFLSMMRLLKRGESVVIEINKTNLSVGINVHGEFYIVDLDDTEKEIIIN